MVYGFSIGTTGYKGGLDNPSIPQCIAVVFGSNQNIFGILTCTVMRLDCLVWTTVSRADKCMEHVDFDEPSFIVQRILLYELRL